MEYMSRKRMKILFDNTTICWVPSPSNVCSLGGHTKSSIPTMVYCLNLSAQMVAPRSLVRVLLSAGSRFQWSTWYSPSRFPASSLPTPPALHAATLRSRRTQPIQTSNEIHLVLFQKPTSDEVRRKNNNSHHQTIATIAACQHDLQAQTHPATSHHIAPSHQTKPHNSAHPPQQVNFTLDHHHS
jgi:hypothetical protein